MEAYRIIRGRFFTESSVIPGLPFMAEPGIPFGLNLKKQTGFPPPPRLRRDWVQDRVVAFAKTGQIHFLSFCKQAEKKMFWNDDAI
jgi:hypothetical protein